MRGPALIDLEDLDVQSFTPSREANEYFCSMTQIEQYETDSTQQSSRAIVKSALGVGSLSGRARGLFISVYKLCLCSEFIYSKTLLSTL